jgi:hypothetical protein
VARQSAWFRCFWISPPMWGVTQTLWLWFWTRKGTSSGKTQNAPKKNLF